MTTAAPRPKDWIAQAADSAVRLALGPLGALIVIEPVVLWPLSFGITCGAIGSLLALPVAWLRLRKPHWLTSPWAVTTAIASSCLMTAKPWFLDTGWPIVVACFLLWVSGPLWTGVVRRHRVAQVVLWLTATLVTWASARVWVGLYPTLHMTATLLGLSLASYAATCALPPRLPSRVLWLAAPAMLASVLLSLTPWGSRVEVRAHALAHGCATPDLLAMAWGLADFDNDGAATIWGGMDCAAFDPNLGPGNWDVPGDGVDQDCTGSDRPVRSVPTAARAHAAPIVKTVVIITGDSLRFDSLGAYGRERRAISPNIDVWARGAVRFERAYAAAPETRTSLPVLLWGLDGPLRQSTPLGLRVREGGARLAHAVLPTVTGLDDEVQRAGFTLTSVPETDASRANAHVWRPLQEVLHHGGVLWVHYHDPHAPYVEVPGVNWGNDSKGRHLGLVTRLDRAVGEVLERLPPAVAVIFSSDHGEAFGEHGMYYHRSSLYDEQIRVPLLISAPHTEPGVVDQTVGVIDLYATTLDLLGLVPTPGVDSRSLVPALHGEALTDLPYRASTWRMGDGRGRSSAWVGLFYREFKLLRRTDWNLEEVYDLASDPQERKPNSAAALRMRETLRAMQ